MGTIRAFRLVGIAGALTLPSLAVATLDIPHVFQTGEIVSALQLNENFSVLSDRVEQKPLLFTSRKSEVFQIEPDNTAVNYSSVEVRKPTGVSG